MSGAKPVITDARFKRTDPGKGPMTEMTISLKGNEAGLFVAQKVIWALLRGEGEQVAQHSAEDLLCASAERDKLRAEVKRLRAELDSMREKVAGSDDC